MNKNFWIFSAVWGQHCMSVQKLKAHLAAKSENELIKEITILYQQFSVVKDFYTVQMSADGEREVFTKHKKIIQEQFSLSVDWERSYVYPLREKRSWILKN
jgi:hypothetical protein